MRVFPIYVQSKIFSAGVVVIIYVSHTHTQDARTRVCVLVSCVLSTCVCSIFSENIHIHERTRDSSISL